MLSFGKDDRKLHLPDLIRPDREMISVGQLNEHSQCSHEGFKAHDSVSESEVAPDSRFGQYELALFDEFIGIHGGKYFVS